jgi:hypothetical protein
MDRGSSKHSPRLDDQMAEEVLGVVRGTAGGRAEEWRMPEPPGEDQPGATLVPDDGYGRGEPNGVGSPQGEEFSRFGTYIGRAFPGDRDKLRASARNLGAPDDVLDRLATLPPGTVFHNVADVWNASTAG